MWSVKIKLWKSFLTYPPQNIRPTKIWYSFLTYLPWNMTPTQITVYTIGGSVCVKIDHEIWWCIFCYIYKYSIFYSSYFQGGKFSWMKYFNSFILKNILIKCIKCVDNFFVNCIKTMKIFLLKNSPLYNIKTLWLINWYNNLKKVQHQGQYNWGHRQW